VLRINRGTAGALDRVAQIAEHKYCRPQARPFRLGFPRKVPVFPLCSPAALLSALEARCPDRVPIDRWQLAVHDGRRFLAQWGDQAEALGWTAKDLFGLLTVPEHTKPTFNRLARYDATGLIWLLQGREVIALAEATAAIRGPTGAVTIYRRHDKPAVGPLGDSLDDLTQ
jgi:hypothetical protein